MDELANIMANKPAAQVVRTGRRGRPKGLPKPPGSGRTLGVPNRITRDIRATAAKHSTKAIATLVKLLGDSDPKVRAIAAREILDRAHGKPMTPVEATGKDGAPLNPPSDVSAREIAHRLIFSVTKDLHDKGFTLGKDGRIAPRAASPEAQATPDRRAQIEAAQAERFKHLPAVAETTPVEEDAARQEREAEAYYASRRDEQGLRPPAAEFNVVRMKPRHA